MAEDKAPKTRTVKAASREDRLKSALKANMARRKAQARARAGSQQHGQGTEADAGNAQTAQDKES